MLDSKKSMIFLEGINKREINGEIQNLLDLNNTLLLGLDIACSSKDGTDGLEIIDTTEKILKLFNEDNSILHEKDIDKTAKEMLLNTDITKQLLYATKFTNLVCEKVYKKHMDNLNKENKRLKNEYENLKNKYELKLQIAIKRERKATEEMNKLKRKHDKEVRVLEHEIKNLNKKLEEVK